jgi:ssRNA-specific RNase YbeY (16S rRNA maturation enzyme)
MSVDGDHPAWLKVARPLHYKATRQPFQAVGEINLIWLTTLVQDLNKTGKGKDKPTNVLSFLAPAD